jgi:putative membrane protein
MAWIRTSLSMISFGFSIDTFFRTLAKVKGLFGNEKLFEPTLLGLVLVGLGTTVMVLGIVEHLLYMKEINAHLHFTGTKGPWTYMLGVALFISIVGSIIFFYLLAVQFL